MSSVFFFQAFLCLMVTVYVSFTDIASYNLSINNLFTKCLAIFGNKKARQLGSVALWEATEVAFGAVKKC